ncbi:glycosyltransferase family 2 protein, partial [Klebsiella pneumoniae]
MKYYVAIPTYNGGELWKTTVFSIKKNTPKETLVQVIDSSSTDGTDSVALNAGFELLSIPGRDFNHGGTRNLAVEMHHGQYELVIFLTQDAIPQMGFLEKIIDVFKDERVVCAYGRQIPHDDANPLAQHARKFNYTDKSYICSQE